MVVRPISGMIAWAIIAPVYLASGQPTAAQGLGRSVITGANMDVTKSTANQPFVWGTVVPKDPVPCSDTKTLQAETVVATITSVDTEKRTVTLKLPKGAIFSAAPMWGAVVIMGSGREYQTLDDNLHISVPVCKEAKADLKTLKPGQKVQIVRDGAAAPGAIQSVTLVK